MAGFELDSLDLTKDKLLVIVGGVHGAGKSSFCRELIRQKSLPYLTNEEVRKEFTTELSRREIHKIISERVREFISSGRSFYFEHVMSGHFVEKLIALARNSDYNIHLVYIDIGSSQKALSRIEHRLKLNGHDVERNKVEERLKESRDNFLKKYQSQADSWELYNNEGEKRLKVATSNKLTGLHVQNEVLYEKFTN